MRDERLAVFLNGIGGVLQELGDRNHVVVALLVGHGAGWFEWRGIRGGREPQVGYGRRYILAVMGPETLLIVLEPLHHLLLRFEEPGKCFADFPFVVFHQVLCEHGGTGLQA